MKKLSKRAEEILREIILNRDSKGNCNTNYWKERFENLPAQEEMILRSLFKELCEADMISVAWADDYPYLLMLLGNGFAYFEEKETNEEQTTATYINNIYGNASGIQIQQGTTSSEQNQTLSQGLNEEAIVELINTIKKYDAILSEEYGEEAAEIVKDSTMELENMVNTHESSEKIWGILQYIRDLSVNAGGGLIASGILQLINMILR